MCLNFYGKSRNLSNPVMIQGGIDTSLTSFVFVTCSFIMLNFFSNKKNMKKPIKVKKIAIGIGKAKDYPGIKKIIEMNKKGKKRFARGGKVKTQEEQPRRQGRSGLKPPPPGKRGKGLRRLTKENCDLLVSIANNNDSDFNTLNVSVSSALALYELMGRDIIK